jgi:uncharacterized protein (TIGR03086 family)
VHQFDSRVRAVRAGQWTAPTPDSEWDVRQLVGHVVAGQWAVSEVLDSRPAAAAGGSPGDQGSVADEVADDPVGAWERASAAALAALSRPHALDRAVTYLHGEVSAVDYCWQASTELTVHAWDLARAIGAADEFPNDLLAEVLDHAKESFDRWHSEQRYAASIPVPGCTDDLTELLALTGRNRWWRPA